jgi:hypothetical protein
MELEITWRRIVRVWWAYTWRNLIALVAAAIIGGIIGFILGFVGHFIGIPTGVIQIIAAVIGCSVGLIVSLIPMKMILGKNYGEFRLVLLPSDTK